MPLTILAAIRPVGVGRPSALPLALELARRRFSPERNCLAVATIAKIDESTTAALRSVSTASCTSFGQLSAISDAFRLTLPFTDRIEPDCMKPKVR